MISTSAIFSAILILLSTFFFVNIVYKDFIDEKKQRNLLIESLKKNLNALEISLEQLKVQKKKLQEEIFDLKKHRDFLTNQEMMKFKLFCEDINNKSEKILEHNQQKYQQIFQNILNEEIGQEILNKIGEKQWT